MCSVLQFGEMSHEYIVINKTIIIIIFAWLSVPVAIVYYVIINVVNVVKVISCSSIRFL